MYLLGLPALVINGVVTKIFQSLQRLREKIFLALQYTLTNVAGNIILVKTLGIMGLAISSTVAVNLHLLLSLIVLSFFRNGLGVKRYAVIIGRSYLMALIAWGIFSLCGIDQWVTHWLQGESILWTLLLAVSKFAALIALYGIQVLIWVRFFHRRS